jgi:hypothetical protein
MHKFMISPEDHILPGLLTLRKEITTREFDENQDTTCRWN